MLFQCINYTAGFPKTLDQFDRVLVIGPGDRVSAPRDVFVTELVVRCRSDPAHIDLVESEPVRAAQDRACIPRRTDVVQQDCHPSILLVGGLGGMRLGFRSQDPADERPGSLPCRPGSVFRIVVLLPVDSGGPRTYKSGSQMLYLSCGHYTCCNLAMQRVALDMIYR